MGKRLACVMTAAAFLSIALVQGQTTAPTVPASIRPVFDRALTYYRKADADTAIRIFDEVIRLQPTFARAYVLRGSSHMLKGHYGKGLADFNQAIRIDPRNAAAYCDRADLEYHFLRRPENALADYNQAIRLAPNFQRAYFNRGIYFLERCNYDPVIADFTRAIHIVPSDLSAYAPRAYAHARRHDHARALADARIAIKLKPGEIALARVVDLGLRGTAYRIIGEPELAMRDFREAVRLMPNGQTANDNLAWFLATCPEERFRNGTDAVCAANRACEISQWKSGCDTLAVAYAEAGDFDQAVKYEKQALNDSSLAPKEREEREKRLALFEQRKPFREDLTAHPSGS
jgi:tetratricopeptide (TPR) repeat protein